MGHIDPTDFAATLIVIFFGIGLHEYAHCKLADAAGDPTPRYYGRVTLNLFKHFEPLGTIMIILTSLTGFGIGWGRPAPMDSRKMRNPRWDFFAAVAAGPISNFFQAVVYAALMRAMGAMQIIFDVQSGQANFIENLLFKGAFINLSLMFFNLIPFGPLDGHWLFGELLPEGPRLKWYLFNNRVGMIGLFGLILIGQFSGFNVLDMILGPPVFGTFKFLVGIKN